MFVIPIGNWEKNSLREFKRNIDTIIKKTGAEMSEKRVFVSPLYHINRPLCSAWPKPDNRFGPDTRIAHVEVSKPDRDLWLLHCARCAAEQRSPNGRTQTSIKCPRWDLRFECIMMFSEMPSRRPLFSHAPSRAGRCVIWAVTLRGTKLASFGK